jgi:hypothetical protein
MQFGEPMSFREAVQALARRQVMPTSLDSAGLSQLSAGLRRQALFSARTTLVDYLDEVKRAVGSILDPQEVAREGAARPVQEGLDPATARLQLRAELARLGYAPGEKEAEGITDLSSDARIDLVVKTNVQLAQGAGDFVRQNDPDLVELWPAWELYRLEEKDTPRDWEMRWRIACQVANDPKAAAALELHGRMAALKSSGVWQALGDGAGGYLDTLGNPYPPFAFNSGMWTQEVDRMEAEELGLIGEGESAAVNGLDLSAVFGEPDLDGGDGE